MFHSDITLKEGAILISDAHYSHLRGELFDFLMEISSQTKQPPQIIFMGDIFDALFAQVKHTLEINAKMITLINSLSENIEIIYLEGNHDFNLHTIFPSLKVFPIKSQPVVCNYNGKKILLSHGDFTMNGMYSLYTKIIRNPLFLSFLSLIDTFTSHAIIKRLDAYLRQKDDCKKIENFKDFSLKRVAYRYDCDYFIDGHFHQNRRFLFENLHYINLAAFACNQRYFIVKSLQNKELLEENSFSKGIKNER